MYDYENREKKLIYYYKLTYHYIVLCPYYIEILTRKKKP